MLSPEQSRAYEALSIGAVAKLAAAARLGRAGVIRESSSLSRPTNSESGGMAYTGDLKSPALGHEGSTPSSRTKSLFARTR